MAIGLAFAGMAPHALRLIAIFWAIYGFVVGLTAGIMEPVVDGFFHLLANVGLVRVGGGYSAIDDLRVGVALVDLYDRRAPVAACTGRTGSRTSGVEMTRLIFWDVDTLHDFMKTGGKLYVSGAEEIIPVVQALTDFAHTRNISIVASADNHDASDAEISEAPDWKTTFPPHCMRGTPGQLKIAETALRDPLVIEPEPQDPGALAHRISSHRGDYLLHKRTVDVFTNANTVTLLRTLEPEAVVLYGVATDFCNRHTVEGLLRHSPRSEIHLVTDAMRAIYPEEGRRLLAAWRERGVHMVESRDLFRGGLDAYLPARAV